MTDVRKNLLRKLLQKIATEQKHDNPDIEIVAEPTTGGSFTSQLFHGTIKSTDKRDIKVFAKVVIMGETWRKEAGLSLDLEPHFYTKMVTRYKQIQDKYNVPQELRLVVPEFYGCNDNYLEEVLVLQDMSKDGFVTHERTKSIDWDYASKAIEELAKFHALSIAYQKDYPEEYLNTKELFNTIVYGNENGQIVEMYKKSMAPALQMVREENRAKLQNFFEIFNPKTIAKFYLPKKRTVIVHNDYRQSNLMHKIEKDGKIQVVIVDYQTLNEGSVFVDLLYFIFTGSDGAFRAQYYDRLIEHYYENLAAALRRLNLDPEEAFPRTDFDEELKEALPFGLMVSSLTLPVITIDPVDVAKTEAGEFEFNSIDDLTAMLSKGNALCARRLNEVIDDYVKWGVI